MGSTTLEWEYRRGEEGGERGEDHLLVNVLVDHAHLVERLADLKAINDEKADTAGGDAGNVKTARDVEECSIDTEHWHPFQDGYHVEESEQLLLFLLCPLLIP